MRVRSLASRGRVGDRQWRLDLCAVCIWLIHSAICMFYTCAERMIEEGSVPASRPLCLHVVLSVPQYHLFSSTTSQRRGTDNTAANAVFPASYGCKDLLPSVACYFSPFLTSPEGCCIFAVSKNRPLPSPLCPPETGATSAKRGGGG